MIKARISLEEKLQKKEITKAVYDTEMKELIEFEKRKSAIIMEMK